MRGTPAAAAAATAPPDADAAGGGAFPANLAAAPDWEQNKRSYELIARYVMPHFQRSNELRQFSYDYSTANREAFVGAAQRGVEAATKAYEEKSGKEWVNPRGQATKAAE